MIIVYELFIWVLLITGMAVWGYILGVGVLSLKYYLRRKYGNPFYVLNAFQWIWIDKEDLVRRYSRLKNPVLVHMRGKTIEYKFVKWISEKRLKIKSEK